MQSPKNAAVSMLAFPQNLMIVVASISFRLVKLTHGYHSKEMPALPPPHCPALSR